jgi:subtilisin family serine protease
MKKLVLTSIIFLTVAISSYAQHLSEALIEQFIEKDKVDCIIIMQDQMDLYGKTNGWSKDKKANFVYNKLKSHAEESQKQVRSHLMKNGITFQSFFVFNGFRAKLTFEEANEILNRYKIEKIVFNSPSRIQPLEFVKSKGSRTVPEWGILKIKADSVWQMGYQGEGVVVAGQDTGYDFDNGLILSKYRGYEDSLTVDHNYNWHDAIDTLNPLNMDTINDPSVNPCGFLSEFPCDDHGHGSHTMGTMVGSDTANQIGVAPEASWIGCRNMDRGWGMPSTYTECFEWFLAPTDLEGQNPDPSKAPHVINNSWGCPQIEGCNPDNWSFMETVVNNLTAAGTMVVASAGNNGGDGCSSIRNPAAIFENSFTIGATKQDDNKAGFSSIGPVMVDSSGRLKPDVVAPGVGVRSIWLNDGFVSISGTSMSGPHVAGAVALLISAKPSLAGQVDEIKDLLKSTAVPLLDSLVCNGDTALITPNFYSGYGRIDILAAVKKALIVSDVNESVVDKNILHVFPNPNNGSFIISTITNSTLGDVYIRDVSGKVIQYHPLTRKIKSVLIEDLPSGMYIYTVQNGNSVESGKVIVGR